LKFIIKLLLILTVAILFVTFSLNNNGHIIVLISRYRIDLSLVIATLGIVVAFIIAYYILRLIINVNRIPNKVRRWQLANSIRASRKYLNNAGVNYFEGKYISAYNNALKSINKEIKCDNKFLALLIALKSASNLADYQKEQQLLIKLDNYSEKKWQLAKLIVTAESLYAKQEYSSCLDYLNQILKLAPRHMPARIFLLKVYLAMKIYDKAFMELTWLTTHKGLFEYQIESYRLRVLDGLFANIADEAELYHFYRKLDKSIQDNGLISKFYFDAQLRLTQYHAAITFIKSIHDKMAGFLIDENILLLAKKITNPKDAEQLLTISESYLPQYKNSYALLLAIGILSATLKVWDRAKTYIESSLMLKPSIDGYVHLSLIAASTENTELARHVEAKLLENIHNLR